MKDELSVETPYETRFFSVILDENGERKSVDTGKIAAVSSSDAVTYATQVYGAYKAASGEKKGFLGDYRFGIYEKSDGYLVIFVDCGRTLSAFYRFVRNTIIIAVLGMLAVWVLLSFASGRIVKPIAESYEKQKGFITDAGHELKTPLAIINADADVLAMDVGDGNEWVSDIKLQAKRLSELTADLIALSRLEENNESIPHTELDFSALVKEITDSFAGPAISRKLKLSSEIAENCKVSGNEKALTRLLSVLLDNAMKYTVVDGDVKVTLVKKSSRQLRLSVNNAIAEPLEKEQLERMFDRFYRTDASRNSEMGGHGIGLSIAAAIVKNHKGTITALCPSEHELSIKITLPII
ncbi:MAG: HAMP domain-containing histidine kinase [Lachnospiraceae bacterium]|nr:HAMP domain-containing histidine kinase [Lachnospiraceae bacterium]